MKSIHLKSMVIVSVCLSLMAIGPLFIIPAHALDLAPQEEGPTFDETVNWIKNKIDSLPSFEKIEVYSSSTKTTTFEKTIFDVNSDNMMTIVQTGIMLRPTLCHEDGGLLSRVPLV